MSKNTTKKGLALGAGIALVASALVGAPASADTTGPITLVPSAGTTFNSILQSGITLSSEIDPARTSDDGKLTFIIGNPGAKKLTLTYTGSDVNTSDTKQTEVTSATALANGATGPDWAAAGAVPTADLTAKFIYVSGSATNISAVTAGNTLAIATAETTANVTVTVQAFLDLDKDGYVDTFEPTSDVETVILYAPGNVSATTTIDYLVADNSAYRTTVAYNNSINPFQVAARTYGKLFNGGTLVDVTGTETDTTDQDPDDYTVAAVAASATAYSDEQTIGIAKNTLSVGVTSSGVANAYYFVTNNVVDMAVGTYTAQTYYYDGSNYLAIGAASKAYDMNVGISAVADTLDASVTETANLDFDGTSTVAVRTGTKSFDIAVQAQDGGVTLAASNLKIKATVTAVTLDSGAVSVTGSSTTLAEDDVTVAYGYTNSKGIATFTIGNTVGTEDDQVTAKFEILDANGLWVDAETVTATWADATLASWSSVGGNYVSGSTVALTFKAVDQFGVGVSVDDSAALAVVATAYVGGIAKPLTYSKTTSVVDGVATFSFANYATAGGSAQLQAVLKAGASNATPTTGSATITVNVYNSNATSSVTVADSFSSAINYADYVTGSKTSAAVVAAATASGISSAASATISGNVLDVNGVGQPGVAVTLSADGVLFADASAYAEDAITTYANEYGAFSVTAYSHVVNATGATVSITADGVSASTKLKSYLPNSINDENLAFSWNLPAELVKNTTYAVVATLTDKWGNPIAAKDTDGTAGGTDYGVAFQGTGSIEVNGVGTTVYKDFSSKGEVTVFVRSIKDIAGPGAISATISGDSTYATGNSTATSTLGTVDAANTVDDTATVWDETLWASTLSAERDVKDVASVVAADTKVNAGSFKGYVAVYAKGYKGQRLSAKVGKDWVVVPALASDFVRIVEFTGAGVDVAVRIYIDRVLVDTINLTTK